jgi:hypothetical protein
MHYWFHLWSFLVLLRFDIKFIMCFAFICVLLHKSMNRVMFFWAGWGDGWAAYFQVNFGSRNTLESANIFTKNPTILLKEFSEKNAKNLINHKRHLTHHLPHHNVVLLLLRLYFVMFRLML